MTGASARAALRPRVLRVDRLVAKSVLASVLLVWVVLVALDAFRIFVSELDGIGGDYTMAKAVTYVLLTLPRRFHEMFGFAALIGGLLGLGALAGTGELTALRAAGMSRLRICASVVLCLAVLTAAVVVLGETLGPWGERRAQALQLAAKSKDVALGSGGMIWARDGRSVIGARNGRSRGAGADVDLADVRVFEFDDDGRLLALSVAKQARHGADGWALEDVRRTEFGADFAVSVESEKRGWRSGLDPHLLADSILQPKYMSLRDLSRNIRILGRNQQDFSAYQREYWERMFHPLTVLVLALCAMPFAFGALRSGGLSRRLFIGIVLAIGFFLMQRSVVNLGIVYGLHPALANLAPPLILIAAAWGYFRRRA